MRESLRLALVALLMLLTMRIGHAAEPVGVLPNIDFQSYFPYLIWASSEGHDAGYPAGFRYKLLSERNADSTTVEFALVRELPDGTKTIALRGHGALAGFDKTGQDMVEQLGRSLGVTFERFDLREVHNLEEFREKSREFGWEEKPVPK